MTRAAAKSALGGGIVATTTSGVDTRDRVAYEPAPGESPDVVRCKRFGLDPRKTRERVDDATSNGHDLRPSGRECGSARIGAALICREADAWAALGDSPAVSRQFLEQMTPPNAAAAAERERALCHDHEGAVGHGGRVCVR